MQNQIIITWVSGSWKTSVMDGLIQSSVKFIKPIQFTTREPRDDKELDSYVFITKNQFMEKLDRGDFVEFTEYNWNLYAIGSHINASLSNVFIVEPVGRAALKKHFRLNWIPYKSFFLQLDASDARNRMIDRWDNKSSIENRLKDFKYFFPDSEDTILDASLPVQRSVYSIKKYAWVL